MPKRVKCARCGRTLKHPHYFDNKPYGSTCFTKVSKDQGNRIQTLERELKTMKVQIRELTRRVQNNGSSQHISNPTKTIDNIETTPGTLPFIGMNYGCDHQELMTELKKVLAARQH